MLYPERISGVDELENLLSLPSPELVDMMRRLDGDLMILGISGKMGITLGRQAVQAIRAAGGNQRVIGVSRFSQPEERQKLERWGLETIACDLLDRQAVAKLPACRNLIFMAGRKFGTGGSEHLTWAMNALAPALVGEHFHGSRIVVFSTGCVYPLVSIESCGSRESDSPEPAGEYAQSCLGRERIFQYCAEKHGSKILLFRLNYAVDLRYGVLCDIARTVWEERPVDNSVGFFNVIWQGDANANAIRALELAANPVAILNVTGPEIASVEQTAREFGRLFGKKVTFKGNPGQRGYLNNAARMCDLLGYPRVALNRLIAWQADWIKNGNPTINKPTHFEVSDGKF